MSENNFYPNDGRPVGPQPIGERFYYTPQADAQWAEHVAPTESWRPKPIEPDKTPQELRFEPATVLGCAGATAICGEFLEEMRKAGRRGTRLPKTLDGESLRGFVIGTNKPITYVSTIEYEAFNPKSKGSSKPSDLVLCNDNTIRLYREDVTRREQLSARSSRQNVNGSVGYFAKSTYHVVAEAPDYFDGPWYFPVVELHPFVGQTLMDRLDVLATRGLRRLALPRERKVWSIR